MTCFPLQFSRLARTSIRRSAAPVRSGPSLETATAPPRELRMDRQRRRRSSWSVMNAGDQACPETRPCLGPSPGGRKPTRTLAGKADGTDGLLGNVESQHRHAAQLNTYANPFAERLVGSIRRECLDHVIVFHEAGLRRILKDYFEYYNYASYYPPRYVVENSKPFCCDVGIVVCRLLRRTRSTNLAVASVSSAR